MFVNDADVQPRESILIQTDEMADDVLMLHNHMYQKYADYAFLTHQSL